jgi:hypothetical protein
MTTHLILDFSNYVNPKSSDPLVMCRHGFCPNCQVGNLEIISECGFLRSVSCSLCGSTFLYSRDIDYFLRILTFNLKGL